MDIVIKASVIAIVSAVCCLLIKKSTPELAYILGAASAVSICSAAVFLGGKVIEFADNATEKSGLSPTVFMPVIKCVGIAVIVKIICGLCKDAGQAGIATAVEYLGAVAALYTALPLMESLLGVMGELI